MLLLEYLIHCQGDIASPHRWSWHVEGGNLSIFQKGEPQRLSSPGTNLEGLGVEAATYKKW
jgi:hypothetical protein